MKTLFKRKSSCVLQMKQGMQMLLDFLLKIFQECTVSPHRKKKKPPKIFQQGLDDISFIPPHPPSDI